jgi:cell division protein FtsL
MRFYKTKLGVFKIKKEKVFWFAVLLMLLLMFTYFYLVRATAFNAVKITEIRKEVSVLNQEIGSLEFEIIAVKNNLNLELAYSMGFKETNNVRFIQRKSVATIFEAGNIQ